MSGGIKSPAFDGAGYNVGAPSVSPAGGLLGLVDFVGYSVGGAVVPVTPPEPVPGGSIPPVLEPVVFEHEVSWTATVDVSATSLFHRGRRVVVRRRAPLEAPPPLEAPLEVRPPTPIVWKASGELRIGIALEASVRFRSRLAAVQTDDEELFELGIFDDSDE